MLRTVRKPLKRLKLRQLDTSLKPFQSLRKVAPPRPGWLTEVRKGLGMTTAQLARRLGVTKQRVGVLERAEAEGKLTLASLKRAAQALGCDLVYAIVPRDRKSTRLNSSHQIISYAVFCLKKKNQRRQHHGRPHHPLS